MALKVMIQRCSDAAYGQLVFHLRRRQHAVIVRRAGYPAIWLDRRGRRGRRGRKSHLPGPVPPRPLRLERSGRENGLEGTKADLAQRRQGAEGGCRVDAPILPPPR